MERVHVEDELQYEQLVRKLEQSLLKNSAEIDKVQFDLTKISSVRFLHSIIEKLTIRLSYTNIVQYTEWIKPIIMNACEANPQNNREALLELIRPYLNLRLNPHNAIKCHNVCVLLITLQEFSNFVAQLPVQPVYTFLMHNLFSVKTFFNDPQRMINLFVVIDRMRLSQDDMAHLLQQLSSEPSLLATLWWCADLYGRSDCVTRLVNQPNNEQITYKHLQVGFCARWFLKRALLCQTLSRNLSSRQQQATLNREDKSKHLKLSPDCLSARSDWSYKKFKWQYVRSTCAVNSGVHYYEVVLITGEPMRIGWTYITSKRTSLVADKVKEGIFTISFNGHDKLLCINKRKRFHKCGQIHNINLKLKSCWAPGDVVGCLINFDKFKLEFYLNGQLVYQLEDVHKYILDGQQSYYASISLYEHQQCYCNFGQTAFKYAPKDVKFKSFNNNDDHVINLNHIESKSEQKWYEFKENVLAYDRVEGVFENDEKQTQIDKLVKQIEQNIHSKQPLVVDLSREHEYLRMIQSIIEQVGSLLGTKLDILLNWIDQHLIRHMTVNVNPHFPDLVCQVLYPYFQLNLTSDTLITHRNVCALLCQLSDVIPDLNIRVNLHKQMITYLCTLVNKYCDLLIANDQVAHRPMAAEWMLLLTIVALGNLNLDDATKQMLRDNAKLCKIIKAQSYATYEENVNCHPQESKYLLLQSQFCTQWFLGNVLKKEGISTTADDHVVSVEKPIKLYSTNYSSKVKLSQDRLTVRSDSNWQSVRSNCCTYKAVYYEVTLHTNGPMRIGWATGQAGLNQNIIGTDQYSIGYDGFNRLVWHDNVSYLLNVAQWKAGDIVGCLISRGEFSFYLNEGKIEYPKTIKIHYSEREYFAAASLSTQQQCDFNFNKTIYHSRRPTSRNFDSIGRIKLRTSNFYKRVKNKFMPTNANNTIIADGNSQFQGNIQIIYNGYSANSSTKQASCSTESTVSTRKECETKEFSSFVNEQLLKEIMEEENDYEIEDDFEMNYDESEV